jgi:hypothetical protein
MRLAFIPQLGENVEPLAFKGMVRSGHPDLAREISDVGSVS